MEERTRFADQQVRVRGTQDGLVLQLPPGLATASLLADVQATIERSRAFFRNSELMIDYGEREPTLDEIVALQRYLSEQGVRVRAITSTTPAYRERLQSWGFYPLRVVGRETRDDRMVPGNEAERTALYVRRTLRSGMSVTADGDVVIVGDVNPGAEVRAGGDVLVWGGVRGTIYAGLRTGTQAIIAALRLSPTLLRIGSLAARAPDQRRELLDEPALAHVVDGAIVVEPWRFERRHA